MKSIVNRREKLRVNDLPPEIPDVSGMVTDTDYATDSAGGVIKVDSTYAIELTSGGKLKAKAITAEAYAEANSAAFVSKATLDNVLAAQPAPPTGATFDTLLEKTTATASGTEVTLLHDYTDYKVLFFVYGDTNNNNTSHGCLIVPGMSQNALGTNMLYGATGNGVRVVKDGDDIVPNKLAIYASSPIQNLRIYGLK